MLVFKAILCCDGPDNFGVPNCTTRVEVEATVLDRLELTRVPADHDVVTYTLPDGWTSRYGRHYCPKCTEARTERFR